MRAFPHHARALGLLVLPLGACLAAYLTGCGDDTKIVIVSGTVPVTDGSGLIIVVDNTSDSEGGRIHLPAQEPPASRILPAAAAPAATGVRGVATTVPALGPSARALTVLLLVWLGGRRYPPREKGEKRILRWKPTSTGGRNCR